MEAKAEIPYSTVISTAIIASFCIYGWVYNIIMLAAVAHDISGVEVWARIIGVFLVPIGIVAGYV